MKKSIIARILSPLALLALAAFVFIQVPSVHAQTITSTPCYQFVTNLTIGSTGADVVALQKLLISKGFSLPSIQAGFAQYGYFGVETQSAVKKYQTSVGIESTGFVGPLTRASLSACSGGQETVVTPLTIEGVTLLTRTDRAGQLSEFRPGNGLNWNFRITINSPTESELDNLFLFGPTGGIWSTAGMYLGSQTWPIVIYRDGVQMNTSYSSDMNIPIRRGVNVFDLFVRSDTETWPIGTAAELAVRLSSGTKSILLPEYGTTTTPTIALKVNDSSGSVTVIPLSNLNFAWTSVNTDRCYNTSQVSGWNSYDSRPINGAVSINAPASAGTFVYSLTCLKANPYPMDNSYATSTVTVNVVATTSTPSITVLSPNGGERIPIVNGNIYVEWKSSNIPSDAFGSIVLYRVNEEQTIGLIDPKINYFNWRMPATTTQGFDYQIGINLYQGNRLIASDRSDDNFSILTSTTTPSITVLSPNGGESYTSVSRIQFSGRLTYIPKRLVAYLYSPERGGVARTSSFTQDTTSTGIYTGIYRGTLMIDHGILDGQYKINLCDELMDSPVLPGKMLCDLSDNYFVVKSALTNLPPVITSVAGKAAGNFEIDAGGSVGIQGTNLAGYKDSTNVYIGGMACTITQLSNTLIYCTAPSNLTVGSTYDLYINTVGSGGDKVTSNIVRVKVLSKLSTNRPPVINGITAPTVLKVNETGTWTIKASDPENSSLSYSIDWGEAVCPTGYVCSASSGASFSQTSSFTHSYATAGTYTVKVTVTDAAGLKAQTSSTVRVDSVNSVINPAVSIVELSAPQSRYNVGEKISLRFRMIKTDGNPAEKSNNFSIDAASYFVSTNEKVTDGSNISTTVDYLGNGYWSISRPVPYTSGNYYLRIIGGCYSEGACEPGYQGWAVTTEVKVPYSVVSSPTIPTATTPTITIVSPRYENLKIGVKHQIKWKDSREKGKGLSPAYVITLSGSNGKQVIADYLATSKWCDDIQCYYDWTPTTASANNQISIYDIANDPSGTLVGRSTIFNIEAGSPVSQKTIKLNASIWEAVKSYFKGTR